VLSRAVVHATSHSHHAAIGGSTPGSMPPFSAMIDEEGVVVYNVPLVRDLVLREADLRALFVGERWPACIPEQTIADVRA
jgi:5-oxoprolinase (ATP-hydrolysing)